MSAAFATLFLAHLIADYPLQSDWLVKAKRSWSGLCVHVGIHLGVLLLLCLPDTPKLWPYLLALATAHFAIDAFKNLLSRHRPQWVAAPYLVDQLLHILSIWAIGLWVEFTLPGGWPLDRPWQIYAVAFLLVTRVWYISERVLFYANHEYQVELWQQRWIRMAARAVLLALLLGVERLLVYPTTVAGAIALLPYGTSTYGRRALVTDVSVTVVVAALLWLSA
jgi:hypothetical protein